MLLCVLCMLTFTCCFPFGLYAQQTNTIDQHWQRLNQQYKKGAIKSARYLDIVDSLTMTDIANPHLKEYLQTYKELVWKNDPTNMRRRRYYYFLIANAKVNGQSGKELYYVEKFVKEPGANDPSHYRNVIKMQLFVAASDINNAAAAFEADTLYYNRIPNQIANGTYKGDPQSDQFLFYQMAPVFFELKDSARLSHLISMAEQTYHNFIKIKGISSWDQQMCYALLRATKCFGYRQQNKTDSAEKVLKELIAYASLPTDKLETGKIILQQQLQQQLLQNVTGQLLDFYISIKEIDSARKYQQIAETLAGVDFIEDDVALLMSRSQIQALSGDYKSAFSTMEYIFQKTDTLLKRKTVEISENMYAQALAEDKKEEATLLLAEKRKLSAIATLGAIILILIIALLYYRGKAKERKAKQSIDGLNRATALQIAELEERNRIEQQLEKKKLGLELHDGLANQLAHLKMLSEIAILDIGKPGTINTLTKINELINTAYETTRDKSHDWYKIKEDTSYAAKISGIVQNALPDELFQKEISIDDYHLNTLPLSTKIELMYIIQESITNVLKHARCTKVMLLIYEEFEHLVFRIKDNGRGLDSRSKSGIGLTSIKERCAELKAKLGISSDKEGTEIVVTIPLHLSM